MVHYCGFYRNLIEEDIYDDGIGKAAKLLHLDD